MAARAASNAKHKSRNLIIPGLDSLSGFQTGTIEAKVFLGSLFDCGIG